MLQRVQIVPRVVVHATVIAQPMLRFAHAMVGLLLALGCGDATTTVEAPPVERVSVPPVVDLSLNIRVSLEEVTVVIEDIAALHALEATHSLDQVLLSSLRGIYAQRPSAQWLYAHHSGYHAIANHIHDGSMPSVQTSSET